jgi:hypothetical protein
MVRPENALAVGQVLLVQGGRRGEVVGCPVCAGQEAAGGQGARGVVALHLPVGVNHPARGRYGLVKVTVTLQEPGGSQQDGRGVGGVLAGADVVGKGQDMREEFPPAGPARNVEEGVFGQGCQQKPGGSVAGLADRVSRAVRISRIGDAGNGLDQAVNGYRVRGQGDHAVGVQQSEGVIDHEGIFVQLVGEIAGDRVVAKPGEDTQDLARQRFLA